MVYIAHDLSPFSSKDVTVYSNCDEVRLIVFQKDTITIKQDRKAFNMPNPIMVFEDVYDFMKVKKLYRAKKHSEASLIAEGIIDGKVVVSVKKIPSNRTSKLKLELANKGIPLIANGSDFITIIASIVDGNGSVKRLNENYIKFEIEGEGSIIGNSDIMANPRKLEWGTAPVLIKSSTKSGSITVKASLVYEGVNTPSGGEITFNSVPEQTAFIHDETPDINHKKKQAVGNSTDEVTKNQKQRILELEKQLNDIKLKKIEKQQQEFEGNN